MTQLETPEWVKRAKIGDKIVCVDNTCQPILTVGKIYSISRIFEVYGILIGPYKDTEISVVLSEVINPHNFWDGSFAIERFKPLSNRSTDTGMKALKSILNGSPITEYENAH